MHGQAYCRLKKNPAFLQPFLHCKAHAPNMAGCTKLCTLPSIKKHGSWDYKELFPCIISSRTSNSTRIQIHITSRTIIILTALSLAVDTKPTTI